MKEPFFSIVITAYNTEKYIKQCICSVINQKLGNCEIIIVDDCSSDNTLKIAEEFSNRVKIIKSQSNMGVWHSRNQALNIARGDYIFFLDGDDWIADNALDIAYKELSKNRVDVLFCPYVVFWQNKNKYRYFNPKYRLKKLRKLKRPFDKKTPAKILYSTNYEVCTKFYKRSFLLENNIKFKELKYAEDLPFYYEVLFFAKSFSYLKKPCYFYRKGHKESLANSISDGLSRALLMSREYSFGIEEIFYKKSADLLNYWLIKTNFDENLYTFAKEFCKEAIVPKNSHYLQLKYKIYSKILELI